MKNLISLFFVLGISNIASAQLVNGSLDLNFSGWQTIGNGTSDTSAVAGNGPQPMMATGFGPMIHPQSGTTMAQIVSGGTSSMTTIENFANVSSGTIQNIQPYPATFGGAIKQKFYGVANSVISFNYLFTTTDGMYSSDTTQWSINNFIYDDFGFCSVSSSSTQFAQKTGDFKLMQIDSTYAGGFHFINGHFAYSVWRVFSYTLPVTDTFTITIGVMNCGDNLSHSDLLADNVTLTNPLSVSTNISSEAISVYPNPANDFIAVSAERGENILQLFSSDGKLIHEEIFENEKTTINISDLPEGFYFYSILNSVEIKKSGKLVIAR